MKKKIIKTRWNLLFDPKAGYRELLDVTFEQSLIEYLLLVLFLGVLSAVFIFFSNIIKAVYIGILYKADIQFMNMLNYTLGQASGTIFFYFFAGTFILFAISLVVDGFFRDIKYIRLLQIFFIALTPFLLFGWIPFLSYTLLIWSIFLLVQGIRYEKTQKKVVRTSINNRD